MINLTVPVKLVLVTEPLQALKLAWLPLSTADNLILQQITKLFPATLHQSQATLDRALIQNQFFLWVLQDGEKYTHPTSLNSTDVPRMLQQITTLKGKHSYLRSLDLYHYLLKKTSDWQEWPLWINLSAWSVCKLTMFLLLEIVGREANKDKDIVKNNTSSLEQSMCGESI